MIIEAVNHFDAMTYCASIAETRKFLRVSVRTTNETAQTLAKLWGSFEFRIHYEAAIWRGRMGLLTVFMKPLFLVGVDDTLRPITKDQFGKLIDSILTSESISRLLTDDDFDDRSFARGFQTLLHSVRHFPSFRKIRLICMNAV